MKTHLNFRTSNLRQSVEFYRTLLDAAPAKDFPDYALFISDDPGLELALDKGDTVVADEAVHYGIAVADSAAVNVAIARLEKAGLPVAVQTNDVCCYARQDKVWVSDPDGRHWEIYTVLEETTERMAADSSCCKTDVAETAATCC